MSRDFPVYQAARVLGMIAVQIQGVAVGWHVTTLTGSPLDLGFVGLAQFLPGALLALVSGHVADRFERRAILVTGYAALAGCALALLALASRITSPLAIYAVLLLVGTVRAFQNPAGQAILPSLVPPERFPRAVALGSTMMQLALVLGPAIGGVAYQWVRRPAPLYGACAAGFLGSALLVACIRAPTRPAAPRALSLATLFAGLRYVWQNKVLLGALSLDLFAVLLGGAVALLPIFAKDQLAAGPLGYGALRSAPAVGGALTGLALAFFPIRRRAGAIMLSCVAIFGVATIAFGLSRTLPLSIAALAIVGASDMVSVYVRQSLVQLTTPDAMRGRVSAVNMVFIGASNELGEFESGVTAAWIGVVPAIVVGGLGTCAVVALWALIFPALRRVDRVDGGQRA